MTKYKRRKVFYLLVTAFLLVSPLLVAYSLGYTLDLVKKDIKKTGGIFLKSKTPRLSIFLNGEFAKETSLISGGALLTDVAPGTYLLRVEKGGHSPWSKTVSVTPEIVTELRNILLLPRNIETATTTRQDLPSVFATTTAIASEFKIDKKENLTRKVGKNTKIISAGVNSFAALGSTIFFVDKNGFLAKFMPETETLETIGRPGFYLAAAPLRFFKSAYGDIVILDSAGGVFLLDAERKITPAGGSATNIYFDSEGEKMLIQKEQSIEVRWLAENTYQPFQKRGAEEIILRLNSPIRDAKWFYKDDAHIVIRTSDGIFLTELDGRGGRNTIELVSGKTDELVTGPEIPGTIFFRKGKIWFKIEL